MQWKELESDVKLESLTEALRRLDCLSALYGVLNTLYDYHYPLLYVQYLGPAEEIHSP